MLGQVNNYNYMEIEAASYWSFPSSYDTKKRQEQLNTMLYSDDYVASEKKDGYWEMIIKDDEGNLTMRARSKGVNGWVCKQDWIPHLNPFFDALPNGTVLIAEVYLEGKTSKSITSILGCGVEKAIERQEGSNKLLLSIFDILAWRGLNVHTLPITERIELLLKVQDIAESHNYVKVVEYWQTPEDIHENWLRILSEDGEGVVMTKKSNPYEFGKRSARHTLKLKKELEETIDVFLTGAYKDATKEYTGTELESWPYWYDEISEKRVEGLQVQIHNNSLTPVTRLWYNEWAGAVEIAVIRDKKVQPIGWISGITDEVRQGIVEDNTNWKGKVVTLQAMEINKNEDPVTLRHAKIVNWRTDKNWEDCSYSQLV